MKKNSSQFSILNSQLLIVIPAIKKNAVIPDQLIKKLNGTTLIQRAIDTAKEITDNILIVTDSEEISLIAERNRVEFYRDATLKLDSSNILQKIDTLTKRREEKNIVLYRANTPLIDSTILTKAYNEFLADDKYILTSVKNLDKKLLKLDKETLTSVDERYLKELKAFYIFKKNNIEADLKPYIIDDEKSIEIENYQDWWICEKVLQRKRVIFNVIGSIEIGMGHIYHSLALAHEISDHEIIFVCDENYHMAVEKIASMDYRVISSKDVLETILKLGADLVINDVLNTDEVYIKTLKKQNIKVVNFEDLGEGSKYANLVFNELYDTPQLEGSHYFWGYEYLALRDEFYNATPHKMVEKVKEVLVTFGGTDQNNLTLLTLKAILNICQRENIKINIVCGSGYLYKDVLEAYINSIEYKKLELTYASGIISKIMERTQIAISSNGRTIYELADMNIPSIVVSHHERENTHSFATLDKGFINLGVMNNNTYEQLEIKFQKLVEDMEYRELLFMNIKKYGFRENKAKVVKKILSLIEEEK